MVKKRMLNRTWAAVLLGLLALSVAVGGSGANRADAAAKPVAPAAAAPKASDSIVMRVYFRDKAERDRLALELNAEETDTRGGYLTVWGDKAMYDGLLRVGIRVEIDQKTTYEANHPNILFGGNSAPDTFDGGYRTVEEMQTLLDQYVANYPTLAQKVDIGNSWCKDHPGSCTQPNANNGYDLFVLHITNQAIAGPKPVYWFDTGIHSREIATPEMSMRLIAWLLDGYSTNADAHWLVDYHDIWIMPMLNPDGHHIVEAGGNNPLSQRKNANNTNGCTTYPPSASVQFGTDLNRNFPFKWNCCGGSSAAPCDQTYHGPTQGSDPETQYITARQLTLFPDQRGPLDTDPAPLTSTGVIQSMHSNAALNLYPWGWTTTASPNGPDLANIGAHMSAANASGNGYQSCQPPACLYSVDGDSFDWSYGQLGVASFTTEVGGSSFFPAYSTLDAMFTLNRGALLYQTKIVRTPYLTTRGPDANNVAATPMTVTIGTSSQLTGTINYAWTGNAYAQNVAAAEYYVDTPPWAGGTAIAMSPTDGSFNSQTEAVNATVTTGALTVGRHILFVRGRGVNSYSGLESWGTVSAAFLDVLPPAGPTSTPTATVTGTPPTATITSTPTRTPTNTNTLVPTNTFTATPTVCTNYTFTSSTGNAIVAGTTDIGNHADDLATTITLPFAYSLYGQAFTGASASSNGTLQFTGSTTAFTNACLPTTTLNNTILAHWDDLRTDAQTNCSAFASGCGIFTSTSGSAPNRIFNIEWRAVLFTGATVVNFEIRLYEGQSRFDLVYGTVNGSGGSATVGVQRDTGSQFVQFSCNTASLSSGLQIVFTLPACGTPLPTNTPTRTFTPGVATNTRTNTPVNTATATATCPPTSDNVDIVDFDYSPQNLTVNVGTTVTWTNNGSVGHTATSDSAAWDSGIIPVGGRFVFTFNSVGTFAYHCTIHPTIMTGTITVVPGCASTSTPTPRPSDTPSSTPTPAFPRDAFVYFADPSGPITNTNPVTITQGVSVTINLRVVSGSSAITAAQSYLTFTSSLLQMVNVVQPGCVLTSTMTGDTSVFDAVLQNETCNGPSPCVFRGISTSPGSIAFASGALGNPAARGDFRVAQFALCAMAPGDALLHWEFSPPAPLTRDSEVVDDGGNIVSDPRLYNDLRIHIVPQVTQLRGHVTIQGRPAQPNALQSVPITFTLKSGSTETNYATTTDASGYFTVTAPTGGVYNWRVKHAQTLANSGSVTLTNGATTNQEMGLLQMGDCNNDNCVNVQDFSLLKNSFGKTQGDPGYDPRADFNGDNAVTVVDFNVQKSNFGICGAPPISPILK